MSEVTRLYPISSMLPEHRVGKKNKPILTKKLLSSETKIMTVKENPKVNAINNNLTSCNFCTLLEEKFSSFRSNPAPLKALL